MKKRLTQILALSVLVVLCLSTTALATARRASLYLNDYYVNSATLSGDFGKIMGWADKFRTLKVRTNADTPADTCGMLRGWARRYP